LKADKSVLAESYRSVTTDHVSTRDLVAK